MTVREYVIQALERFPETRRDRFELVRQVYHMNADRAGASPLQVDSAVNLLQAFRKIKLGVDDVLREQRKVQNKLRPDLKDEATAAERDYRAEQYRERYSPQEDDEDPDQTKLF